MMTKITDNEKLRFIGIALTVYGFGLLMSVPMPGLFIGLGLGFIMLARGQEKRRP